MLFSSKLFSHFRNSYERHTCHIKDKHSISRMPKCQFQIPDRILTLEQWHQNNQKANLLNFITFGIQNCWQYLLISFHRIQALPWQLPFHMISIWQTLLKCPTLVNMSSKSVIAFIISMGLLCWKAWSADDHNCISISKFSNNSNFIARFGKK